MSKYVFVTGGVVSGLGKGITAASLGRLLKARGFKVAAQKLDPYINVDPGTMSPYLHPILNFYLQIYKNNYYDYTSNIFYYTTFYSISTDAFTKPLNIGFALFGLLLNSG